MGGTQIDQSREEREVNFKMKRVGTSNVVGRRSKVKQQVRAQDSK
jgi:hypothetical protein